MFAVQWATGSLYIISCQKMKIEKNSFYLILAIISLVHVATYIWFRSDGSHMIKISLHNFSNLR